MATACRCWCPVFWKLRLNRCRRSRGNSANRWRKLSVSVHLGRSRIRSGETWKCSKRLSPCSLRLRAVRRNRRKNRRVQAAKWTNSSASSTRCKSDWISSARRNSCSSLRERGRISCGDYQTEEWRTYCASRRLRPGGTRLAHAIQEESVLSGVETVLSCDLTKAMQRCANPIQRVTVNTPRHVPWLCSLAPLRYSSQGAQLPCPASGSACRDQGRVSANARAPPRRTKCGVSCLSSYRSARRTLIAERATVLARLRATDQHAAIPIDLDGLCTTPR